tara:strand:- start:292 stop:519 length:228 start_codon:yes stop_codon:yes gene_type:complete
MNSQEFFLWLNGYLEALESEGITQCKIESIRKKMESVKSQNVTQQERIVQFAGPITPQQPQKPNFIPPQHVRNTK